METGIKMDYSHIILAIRLIYLHYLASTQIWKWWDLDTDSQFSNERFYLDRLDTLKLDSVISCIYIEFIFFCVISYLKC